MPSTRLNRSRGRAGASGMAVPSAMDGTMGASYLTMRGQKHVPKPVIGQHDDRAFYHRRRWERSGTTSASWTVSNRCDWRCSHDREWVYKASSKQFRWTLHVEIFVRPLRYK